jgi:hypothetical protein
MPSRDCQEACTHRKQIANLLIRQRDRQIRTDAGRRDCPVGEFQLAEAPSTTPRLRLLVCCIRMPSIFRGVPSPQWRAPRANPQAAEATPGGFALAIAAPRVVPVSSRYPGTRQCSGTAIFGLRVSDAASEVKKGHRYLVARSLPGLPSSAVLVMRYGGVKRVHHSERKPSAYGGVAHDR